MSTLPLVDGSTINADRDYKATPDEVWDALVAPERLRRWFADVRGELRAGGAWTATFDNGSAHGVIAACVPGERAVTSWVWDHDPGAEGEVTLTLTPTSDGTRLELRHDRVAGSVVGQAAGWYAHLAGLAAELDGREGAWTEEFERALSALQAPG